MAAPREGEKRRREINRNSREVKTSPRVSTPCVLFPPSTRKSTRFTGYRNSRFTSGLRSPRPVHPTRPCPDILSNLIKLPRVSGFPWFLGEKGEASMKVGVVKFAKLRELNLRFSRRTSGAKFGRESETVSFDAGKREILTLEEGGGMIGFNNPLADDDGVR